jgi:hypothetical protein
MTWICVKSYESFRTFVEIRPGLAPQEGESSMEIVDALSWFSNEMERAINRFWLIPVLVIFDGISITYCHILLNKKVIWVLAYATAFLFYGSFAISIAEHCSLDAVHPAYIFTIVGIIGCVLTYILNGLISGFRVIFAFIAGGVIPLLLLEKIGFWEPIAKAGIIGLGLQAGVAIAGGTALLVLTFKFGKWLGQYPFTHITVSSLCGALILGSLILWFGAGNNVAKLASVDYGLLDVLQKIDNVGQAIVFLFFWATGFFSQALILKSRDNGNSTIIKLLFMTKERHNAPQKNREQYLELVD